MTDPAQVVLLWGEQAFLLREAAREELGEVRPREVEGAEWDDGLTADLATPSLFGETRALLVVNAQDLPPTAAAEIARYASAPSPEARLVLALVVGPRSKGPPKRFLEALGPNVRTRRVAIDRKDLAVWVLRRAKTRGVPASTEGAQALVDALGEDPAILDQAVEQLASSHAEQGLTPQTVAAQFRGFGERRMWELADAAFTGQLAESMRILAALLDSGEQPLALLGSIAARVRDLIRVRAVPPRTPLAEVARRAGLRYDWQARRYVDQAKRFDERELAAIHRDLVAADGILKQGGPGDVVLPSLISRIVGAASGGRGVRAG